MRRTHRVVFVGAVGLLGLGAAGCDPAPQPWQSDLVTATPTGEAANGAVGVPTQSSPPVFSPDGTKIAFASRLMPGFEDWNNGLDVYIRDLTTGTTTLVSMNADGTRTGNGPSWNPSFNADGTKVAFQSLGNDFGPTDTDPGRPIVPEAPSDVYVRDLTTGATTLVSANAAGTDSPFLYPSFTPLFSPTEDKVAFLSYARDMGPTGIRSRDLFIRDLTTGGIELVSVNAAGTGGGDGLSGEFSPSSPTFAFSPDGTKLAFPSMAGNLSPTDSSGACGVVTCMDVFVRDFATNTTHLVSANMTNTGSGNDGSWQPIFSPDGEQVAFTSNASNLSPIDGNGRNDIFLRDLDSGVTTLVTPNGAGTASANGTSRQASFSPDGSSIAFESNASNLGPPDGNGTFDVYVRNLVSGTTSVVSVNTAGIDTGDRSADAPVFSPDGDRIAFTSTATDLVETGPSNCSTCGQVYVRDLVTSTTTLVSTRADGKAPGNASSGPWYGFDPAGERLAFISRANDLGPTDSEAERPDIYIATLHGADVTVAGTAQPEPVSSGGELTYSLAVANDGPDPAAAAGAVLLLPPGVTFIEAVASQGTCLAPPPEQPDVVICDVGAVGVDDDVAITVRVLVDAPAGSTLDATFMANGAEVDPARRNNAVEISSTTTSG